MPKKCDGCTCVEEDMPNVEEVQTLIDWFGIKQSWIKSGSSVFAFVAWATGVSILLFGDGSASQFILATCGCFLPALVSAAYAGRDKLR